MVIALLSPFVYADEIAVGGHKLIVEWADTAENAVPLIMTPDHKWVCIDCVDFTERATGRPKITVLSLEAYDFVRRDERNKNIIWGLHVAPKGKYLKLPKISGKSPTTVVFATEADCKRGKTRRVVSVIYSDYLEISNVLTTLNEPSPWQLVVPGSYAESYLKLGCNAPE